MTRSIEDIKKDFDKWPIPYLSISDTRALFAEIKRLEKALAETEKRWREK